MNTDQCYKLIELYRSYALLWDPKSADYNDKRLREEAWENISEEMDMTLGETKKKMGSLLGSYRREKSQMKRSIAARGVVYKPKWYAYEWFNFMMNKAPRGQKYHEKKRHKPSWNDSKSLKNEQTMHKSNKQCKLDTSYTTEQEVEIEELERVEVKTNDSLKVKQSLEYSGDPLYTYGQHIANELRKYDPLTLSHVKNAINNIIFEADTGKYDQRNPLMETRTLDEKFITIKESYNQ